MSLFSVLDKRYENPPNKPMQLSLLIELPVLLLILFEDLSNIDMHVNGVILVFDSK